MRLFLLDASALVKRYAIEVGTPLLNHLFAQATPARLLCLTLGDGRGSGHTGAKTKPL